MDNLDKEDLVVTVEFALLVVVGGESDWVKNKGGNFSIVYKKRSPPFFSVYVDRVLQYLIERVRLRSLRAEARWARKGPLAESHLLF